MKKLKNINWNHLYYFYEIARHKSLQQAARYLSISPSTLSEHLKKLENEFHLKLFRRESTGLVLTPSGEIFFKDASEIFSIGSKMIEKLIDAQRDGHMTKVGIPDSYLASQCNKILYKYWNVFTEYGSVSSYSATNDGQILELLRMKEIEWGILFSTPMTTDIEYELIDELTMNVAVNKEIENNTMLPLVIYAPDKLINQKLLAKLKKLEIRFSEVIKTDHLEWASELCDNGKCFMLKTQNEIDLSPNLEAVEKIDEISIKIYAAWNSINKRLLSVRKISEISL